MRGGILTHFDSFARGFLPMISAVIAVILGAIPTQLPLLVLVEPAFALAVIYYWTIYRPDLLNMLFFLLLGLFQDFLTGSHPGVTSFVLLLAYMVVVTQRRFFHGKSFGVVWWGFMLVAFGGALITWSMNVILSGRWIDPVGTGIGLVLTILLYPLLAAILSQVHRAIMAPMTGS